MVTVHVQRTPVLGLRGVLADFVLAKTYAEDLRP